MHPLCSPGTAPRARVQVRHGLPALARYGPPGEVPSASYGAGVCSQASSPGQGAPPCHPLPADRHPGHSADGKEAAELRQAGGFRPSSGRAQHPSGPHTLQTSLGPCSVSGTPLGQRMGQWTRWGACTYWGDGAVNVSAGVGSGRAGWKWLIWLFYMGGSGRSRDIWTETRRK